MGYVYLSIDDCEVILRIRAQQVNELKEWIKKQR
jgi:hypothetical protein